MKFIMVVIICFGVDCQAITPPLHRWFTEDEKCRIECRPPLGAIPLSLPEAAAEAPTGSARGTTKVIIMSLMIIMIIITKKSHTPLIMIIVLLRVMPSCSRPRLWQASPAIQRQRQSPNFDRRRARRRSGFRV